MSEPDLYRHSGRFSVLSLVLGFLVTATIGLGLAYIYAYALYYIPFVYVNALLVLGFGFVLGLIAVKLIIAFKIRNEKMALVMTFLAVLVSYYAAWVVWMAAHLRAAGLDVSMVTLGGKPTVVWDLVRVFNEKGTWSLGRHSSDPVTGIFLTIVWIAEAVMIFGPALVVVFGMMQTPFCEECETWCKEREAVASVGAHLMDALRPGIRGKDWTVLEKAGLQPPHLGTWCTLDLYTCPSCGQTNTLTLNSVTMSTNKKGEKKTETTILIDRLLLTAEETQTLLDTCDRLQTQADAEAAVSPVSEADQVASTDSETA